MPISINTICIGTAANLDDPNRFRFDQPPLSLQGLDQGQRICAPTLRKAFRHHQDIDRILRFVRLASPKLTCAGEILLDELHARLRSCALLWRDSLRHGGWLSGAR